MPDGAAKDVSFRATRRQVFVGLAVGSSQTLAVISTVEDQLADKMLLRRLRDRAFCTAGPQRAGQLFLGFRHGSGISPSVRGGGAARLDLLKKGEVQRCRYASRHLCSAHDKGGPAPTYCARQCGARFLFQVSAVRLSLRVSLLRGHRSMGLANSHNPASQSTNILFFLHFCEIQSLRSVFANFC